MSVSDSLSKSSEPQNPEHFLCGVVEGFYGRPWTLEQRQDLFAKLNKFGMNSFMYAPKDDIKHRQGWRELYTVEEAEQLRLLINSAQSNRVLFFYAISPGLDMQYSNPKEVANLKRKLDQVKELGCTAFAILFDDIELELNKADKEVFNSTGNAHVSVTNEVFQHLGRCSFVFCPTEYCASRASPDVCNSSYLKTVGDKLFSGIDVLWTGTRVISQTITVAQIEELASVLKRKPLIWENLHANDYDQKRVYLGPYTGRSTSLIPHIRGVLTNPNCEYELNYIPIHTLAQWSKCHKDAKVGSEAKFETENNEKPNSENIFADLDPLVTYHPSNALRVAITEWLDEFSKEKSSLPKPMFSHLATSASEVASINTAGMVPSLVCPLEETIEKKEELKETIEVMASEIDKAKIDIFETDAKESLEPMEAEPVDPVDTELKIAQNTLDVLMAEKDDNTAKSMTSVDSSDDMQTEIITEDDTNNLTYEDVALLVDLFYLPFAHGPQALHILQEFDYLRNNGHLISKDRSKAKSDNDELFETERNEWYERATNFNEITLNIGKVLTKLSYCKNKSLFHEIYSYVWDLKGAIGLLNSYVKWIALGQIPLTTFFQPLGLIPPVFTWFSKGYRQAFESGDKEPWLFRGGVTGELQRLLPVESVGDLFLYSAPNPSTRVYTIRPYNPADQSKIYEVCFSNYDKNTFMENQRDLVGDRFIGSFLTLSPEYCFIVEDAYGLICGYVMAVLDAKSYFQKLEMSWIPDILNRYPMAASSDDCVSTSEKYLNEFIRELHNECTTMLKDPENVFQKYPSLLNISLMSTIQDMSVLNRMLACCLAALRVNGSKGVYARVPRNDLKTLEFYLKLNFQIIKMPNEEEGNADTHYVGRLI